MLTPLVALILLLGVYPKPVLDVINPTAAQIVADSGHTDPAPAIEGAEPVTTVTLSRPDLGGADQRPARSTTSRSCRS